MAKKGFYYNQEACIGCKTCQVACKDKNDMETGTFFRHVTNYVVGDYPSPKMYHYAATCNHCENPICVAGCPTGAMHIDEEDGTVQHDDEICIGCQYCVNNCPYGVPQYFPEKNISDKCDACKQLRDNGEDPACVAACPMRALEFGDIEELAKAHPDAVKDITVLPDSSTTSPCTLIDAREAAVGEKPSEVVL